jgi:hypothetical protein
MRKGAAIRTNSAVRSDEASEVSRAVPFIKPPDQAGRPHGWSSHSCAPFPAVVCQLCLAPPERGSAAEQSVKAATRT